MIKIGILHFQSESHDVFCRPCGNQYELVVEVEGEWERLEDTEPFDNVEDAGTVLENYSIPAVYEVELI